MKKVVAVFDFDGTLSRGESGIKFARFILDKYQFIWFLLRHLPFFILYGLRIQHEKMLKTMMRYAFKDRSELITAQMAEQFVKEVLLKNINSAVVEKLHWHQQQGHRCIIVSRAAEIYLQPWAKQMNIDYVCGTRLEINERACYTGEIVGLSCDGAEKVKRLYALLGNRSDYTVYAYGDSYGDNEMLADADYSFNVKKDFLC